MRQLASAQRIVAIEDIKFIDKDTGKEEIAANIVKVQVLGWSCVTQRANNFKPGDLIVYFEVDSILPEYPCFEFLRDRKFYIGTIKLKGQIAQGLILPLREIRIPGAHGTITLLDEEALKACPEATLHFTQRLVNEGDDLTELIGVKQWEPNAPAHLAGIVKGNFPHFMAKTDETRIQSMPGLLIRQAGTPIYITEKLDGTSTTFYSYSTDAKRSNNLPATEEEVEKGRVFGVASRNQDLKFSEGNSYWMMARKLEIEEKLKDFSFPVAIQGEMYGLGIGDNTLGLKTTEFALFNVIDILNRKRLGYDQTVEIAKRLGLTMVPVLPIGGSRLDFTVEQLVNMATRKSTINPNIWAEGIVVRSLEPKEDEKVGDISFKVINPEWLLKYKKKLA